MEQATLIGFADELEKICQVVGRVGQVATSAKPGRALGRGIGRFARIATIPAALYGGYRLLRGRQQPQPQQQVGVPGAVQV
jgi:hypothetical protein